MQAGFPNFSLVLSISGASTLTFILGQGSALEENLIALRFSNLLEKIVTGLMGKNKIIMGCLKEW